MTKIYKWLFTGIIGLIVLGFPLMTWAVTGVQISPVMHEFSLKPGESTSAKIRVTNRNPDEDLQYIIEVENFSQITEDGAPSTFTVANPAEKVSTLADWITVPVDKEGTIKPYVQKEITFNLKVPENADPGGHYAAIFAREVRKTTGTGATAIGVSSRVGTLVLLSVAGTVTKGAEIVSFDAPKFLWRGPADFAMRIKNTGTVHYDSPASVELKSLFGGTSKVDLGKHTILPDSTRKYSATWNKRFPIGYYKLTANAIDGTGTPITTTSTLWALPLEIVLPVILGLLIIIVAIRFIRRRFKITSR